MATKCLILRTNRTMGHKKVKDKCDDFIFEGGTYFIRKEKVFLWKTGILGKIMPTLLYIEGISDPLYLDNIKLKEYYENVPILDKNNKPVVDDTTKKIKTERKKVKHITDIFIDSRTIHNMTDNKILIDLSAQKNISTSEIVIIILILICIIISALHFFI